MLLVGGGNAGGQREIGRAETLQRTHHLVRQIAAMAQDAAGRGVHFGQQRQPLRRRKPRRTRDGGGDARLVEHEQRGEIGRRVGAFQAAGARRPDADRHVRADLAQARHGAFATSATAPADQIDGLAPHHLDRGRIGHFRGQDGIETVVETHLPADPFRTTSNDAA